MNLSKYQKEIWCWLTLDLAISKTKLNTLLTVSTSPILKLTRRISEFELFKIRLIKNSVNVDYLQQNSSLIWFFYIAGAIGVLVNTFEPPGVGRKSRAPLSDKPLNFPAVVVS